MNARLAEANARVDGRLHEKFLFGRRGSSTGNFNQRKAHGLRHGKLRGARKIFKVVDARRFRQYSLYKTFNDADSEDHADLGIKVIDELNFFKELSAPDYDLVKFAIQNHNKKTVAPTDDERKNFFAKIIRDADKLDIYRVLEPFLAQENADKMPKFIKGKARPDISPDFVENFVTGEQADYRKIRTNGDRKIVRLMWLYDINFSWTMQKIVERGFIEKIVSNLPMDERVAEGVRRLKLHVKEKLSE